MNINNNNESKKYNECNENLDKTFEFLYQREEWRTRPDD